MKKLITIIAIYLTQQPILAQKGYIPPLSVLSPQTAEMIRYDKLPVDMYTGRISIDIPLVQIADKDFDFPISVNYDSGGFKPGVPDNYVGRNWSLRCGGIIYREINGIPDDLEFKIVGAYQYDNVRGFLTVYKNHKGQLSKKLVTDSIYQNPYIFSDRYNSSVNVSTIPPLGDKKIECSADTYYFSFGKYTGKFMLNFDGSISSVTTTGGDCTIDLSDYNLVSGTSPYTSSIKIRTDNGYTYVFGGRGYAPLEYTALSWNRTFNFDHDHLLGIHEAHQINAYHLTKIIAPNGREMKIHYRDIDPKYHADPHELSFSTNRLDHDAHLQYSFGERSYYRDRRAPVYEDGDIPWEQPQRSLTKLALIDRIETDNWRINFSYSLRDNVPLDNDRSIFPEYCGAKLDRITFFASGELIEESELKYEYHSGDRMFLSSVSNTKRGTHKFEYKQIPVTAAIAASINPLTTNIDHWGFWRGSGSSGKILPQMAISRNEEDYQEEYKVLSDDREPTGKDCDATLMQKMIFPAGGYCRFEYEPNTWSYRMEVHAPSFVPSLRFPDGKPKALAGGARIKTIKYYDKGNTEDRLVKQTTYSYDLNKSAGIISYMPFYQYLAKFIHPVTKKREYEHLINDSDGINYRPSDANTVCYQYVEERYDNYTDPQSETFFKQTMFSSLNSDPDLFSTWFGRDPNAFEYTKTMLPFQFPLDPDEYLRRYNANLGMKPTFNASEMRGKVWKEEYYSSDRKLVRTEKYKYDRIAKDTVHYIYSLPITTIGSKVGLYSHIGTEHFYRCLLTKKTITEYTKDTNAASLEESYEYEYDKNGYLITKRHLRGTNGLSETVYSYPHQRLVPPDKKVYTLVKDARLLVYEEKYDSEQDDLGNWRVRNIKSAHGSTLESKMSFLRYDQYRNPIHVTKNGGLSTIYIWSNFGQNLIAKIENAEYDEVCLALGNTPESFSSKDSPSMTAIDGLREKLPEAHITTYTYIPFIGLSSCTTPSGQKTNYAYDSARRLIRETLFTEIGTYQILKIHEYNLLNQ